MLPEFSSAVPQNAAAATVSDKPICANCAAPASTHCAACPPVDKTYYCSKACQKADWRLHKSYCKCKKLYAATVDLQMPHDPNEVMQSPEWQLKEKAHKDCMLGGNFAFHRYLHHVHPSQRPRTLHPDVAKTNSSYNAGMRELAKITKEEHNARVLPLQDTLYKGVQPYNVPLLDRPWTKDDDGEGIDIWWTDFEVLSIGMYEQLWDGGRKGSSVDPWSEDMELNVKGDFEGVDVGTLIFETYD